MSVAVILTALPVEYLAVHRHLTDLREEMHRQGTRYERGKFVVGANIWEVGIAEIGAGNVNAAAEVERAIAHFKPQLLFFVGIAGGIKDVAIGSVVAAKWVYNYESGKVDEEQFLPRPKAKDSSYALVKLAEAEAKKHEWINRLDKDCTKLPKAIVRPIASGEKVLASTTSELLKILRSSYGDAIAVEMEGYGFLSAACAYPELKAIVIRGISDLIDGKNDDLPESEHSRQEKASMHASAFAFEMLSKYLIGDIELQLQNLDMACPEERKRILSHSDLQRILSENPENIGYQSTKLLFWISLAVFIVLSFLLIYLFIQLLPWSFSDGLKIFFGGFYLLGFVFLSCISVPQIMRAYRNLKQGIRMTQTYSVQMVLGQIFGKTRVTCIDNQNQPVEFMKYRLEDCWGERYDIVCKTSHQALLENNDTGFAFIAKSSDGHRLEKFVLVNNYHQYQKALSIYSII